MTLRSIIPFILLSVFVLYCEPLGLMNLCSSLFNDHSSAILMQYEPLPNRNLDHSEDLQNSQNLTKYRINATENDSRIGFWYLPVSHTFHSPIFNSEPVLRCLRLMKILGTCNVQKPIFESSSSVDRRVFSKISSRETDHFLDKIAIHCFEDHFPTFPLPDLSEILNQSFFYLSHGEETVAFVSKDGQFVLKFFLQKNMRSKKRSAIPKPTSWMISHYRAAKLRCRNEARRKACLDTMQNYAAAFQLMQKDTGTIALHLTPTLHLLPTIPLFDQQRREYQIDLDHASFVLQHKAILVKDKLAQAATTEEQQKIMQALEDFFILRAQKGFSDIRKSCTLETNFGFLGDRAIQFDVGKIAFSETLQASPEEEISRMQEFLYRWAELNHVRYTQ